MTVVDATRRRTRISNLDQSAQPLHVIDVPMVLDEAEAAHRIVSRAKYAAALRKISLSVRSSMFSLRNRANSSRSDSVKASGSAAR